MKRFSIVENGYDIDEVNRFIDIVIARFEKLNAENAAYAAKIDKLNAKIENDGEHDKIEKTFLAVQETTEKMKEVAREEARVIIDEAKNNANMIMHEALVNASRIDNERMMLEKNLKVCKQKVKSLLEGQLELVDEMDMIEL